MHRREPVCRALVEAAAQRRGAVAAGCAIVVVRSFVTRGFLEQDKVPGDDLSGAEALNAVARSRVPEVALRGKVYMSLCCDQRQNNTS